MNYIYASSMFGLIMIGAGWLISGGLITELANDNMHESNYKWAVMKAKKLDVNSDGLVSLDELTSRPTRRFQNHSYEKDSQIDEAEFNARLVAMFKRMDSNSDGMLDDIEFSKPKHRPRDTDYDNRNLHERWF